jgi:hypothetical protein
LAIKRENRALKHRLESEGLKAKIVKNKGKKWVYVRNNKGQIVTRVKGNDLGVLRGVDIRKNRHLSEKNISHSGKQKDVYNVSRLSNKAQVTRKGKKITYISNNKVPRARIGYVSVTYYFKSGKRSEYVTANSERQRLSNANIDNVIQETTEKCFKIGAGRLKIHTHKTLENAKHISTKITYTTTYKNIPTGLYD